MPAKPKAPVVLGPEWETRIRKELRRLNDLVPLCDQCDQCGIDCAGHRQAIEILRTNLQQFLKVFFGKQQ